MLFLFYICSLCIWLRISKSFSIVHEIYIDNKLFGNKNWCNLKIVSGEYGEINNNFFKQVITFDKLYDLMYMSINVEYVSDGRKNKSFYIILLLFQKFDVSIDKFNSFRISEYFVFLFFFGFFF